MTTAIRSTATEQADALYARGQALSRAIETVLRPLGISYPQARAILALAAHNDPLPLSRLARLNSQEAQSTTEIADRLERLGYGERSRDPRDRRLVLFGLTASGQVLAEQVAPVVEQAAEAFLAQREEG